MAHFQVQDDSLTNYLLFTPFQYFYMLLYAYLKSRFPLVRIRGNIYTKKALTFTMGGKSL